MSALVPPATDPAPGWSQFLGSGAPGTLLLHGELAHCGLGSWATVHEWATATTRHEVSIHPSVGLFRGAPAVAFALTCADRPAYAPTLSTLDHQIREVVTERLAQAHERIDRGALPTLHEFDLITGLTGLGAYLLHRGRDVDSLRDVLAYLVRLTDPLLLHDEPVPGWWTLHGPNDGPTADWPRGHANLGMAHGITGPLALLSIAMRRGVSVADQPKAIERVCAWLDTWQQGTPDAPWWPPTISFDDLRSHQLRAAHPHRPSWCYGVAGLARAMQLAGLALADQRRQQAAEQALASALADGRQLGQITDASLCHGWAGLALTVWTVAADSSDPHRLYDRLPDLLTRLDRHLSDHPARTDGLLEGAAGIALARHTIARSQRPLSRWDACLLLDASQPPTNDHQGRTR